MYVKRWWRVFYRKDGEVLVSVFESLNLDAQYCS
jgi:hypothetical protein